MVPKILSFIIMLCLTNLLVGVNTVFAANVKYVMVKKVKKVVTLADYVEPIKEIVISRSDSILECHDRVSLHDLVKKGKEIKKKGNYEKVIIGEFRGNKWIVIVTIE